MTRGQIDVPLRLRAADVLDEQHAKHERDRAALAAYRRQCEQITLLAGEDVEP